MDASVIAARTAVLRRCSVFSDLPSATIELLAEIVRPQQFRPGETVCEEGEPAGEVFVVQSGKLIVRHAGQQDVVATMRDGELFGEFGMFGRGVRLTTVTAETESVLLSLDYDRFRKFLLRFPESTLALLEVAVGRFVDFGAV
jgi:CRP-like cAMP-binding protein